MRLARFAHPGIAGLVLFGVPVAAFAAPPANDTYAGRIVVGSVPFSTTQDTSEATSDAVDDEINADCGAPAMDASVWYEVTATSDGALVADVSESDYPAGVLVATGSPGSFAIVACGPGAAGWSTVAGETYAVVVIDDQSDGGGNGGTMVLNIDVAPPTPVMDVTVNPRGGFTSTGDAVISGTVSCTGEADFAFLEVTVSQFVGRLKINGFSGTDVTCDGATRPWTLEVPGDNGIFKGGKAVTVTLAVGCGVFECGVDFEERTVQLSRRK